MEIVIDTNILVRGFENGQVSCLAVLSHFYGNFELNIVLDYNDDRGECVVQKEYYNNLKDNQLFQKWIQAMFEGNQVTYKSGKLDSAVKSELLKRGFHEPTDQTFVALAIISDKNIITEDSDYGKGDNPEALTPAKQEVLRFMLEELTLNVMDSEEGIVFLRRYNF